MATQQSIPDFTVKREEYSVHNARPERMEFLWGGTRFEVPGVGEIGPDPNHFDTGEPIPGTVIVRDGWNFTSEGLIPVGGPPNWSAKEAIRAVLGVTPDGTATSKLSLNGVSYLPVSCTRAQYQVVKEAGLSRYRESLVEWATDTVQNYEEARNRAKTAGVDAKPPGPDFYRAQAILKAKQQELQMLYTPEQEAEDDNDIQFLIYAKAAAMKMAGNIAAQEGVDQVKLVERMLEDPKVMANIRKKYSWRKKGYMDPTEAPGAEQPPD